MLSRLSSGSAALDQALGGGFLPGSLTMIIGATGIGKTQLGMHFLHAGREEEGQAGAIIDLSSRGDSQNHSGYTERMFGYPLSVAQLDQAGTGKLFDSHRPPQLLNFLGYSGRRVLRSQMDADQWHAWQSEMNRRSPQLFRFVYEHLVHGTRRFVIDGIEPQGAAHDSLQMDLLELIYHRMLRQEHDWLAREVLRESFLAYQAQVSQHAYEHQQAAAMVLVTTKQSMLEQLIEEPLADGDLAAGANTVILLGKQKRAGKLTRAMAIAKHRGSYAAPDVMAYDIQSAGIVFD